MRPATLRSATSVPRGSCSRGSVRDRRDRVGQVAGDDEGVALARTAAEVRGGDADRVEAGGRSRHRYDFDVVQAIGLAGMERVIAEERGAGAIGNAEVEIVHQFGSWIGDAPRDARGIGP